MLEFKNYSYENLMAVKSYINKCPYLCNDISLGTFYMWNTNTNPEFCVYNNTFIVKETFGDDVLFSYPFGEDMCGAISALKEYTAKNNLPLKFFGVSEELLQQIKNENLFEFVNASYDRKWSDYIYDFNDILTFKGNKYKGQRNHINKFKKLYGEPNFEAIKAQDIPLIKQMLSEYEAKQLKQSYFAKKEFKYTHNLLDAFSDLGLIGVVLKKDNKVISFSIGEIRADMLIIHIEKALTEYQGIYPTTFNGFIKYVNNNIGKLKYINREDDSGDLGLRTSKMQYNPVMLLHKYSVKVNSPVNKIADIPDICFKDFCLTKMIETDKHEYMCLNTDIDNNKYWGYDYREDKSIEDVNEDTFYNGVLHDYAMGESVNFAIRESKDSKLIGEVIIYRFNFNGTAEIGCRLFKEHQGKGLGKKAFAAGADFAESVLGVKLTARCFKENTPSYHMITSCGFKNINEDEKFYYFER